MIYEGKPHFTIRPAAAAAADCVFNATTTTGNYKAICSAKYFSTKGDFL
jgi:hypothetical protein